MTAGSSGTWPLKPDSSGAKGVCFSPFDETHQLCGSRDISDIFAWELSCSDPHREVCQHTDAQGQVIMFSLMRIFAKIRIRMSYKAHLKVDQAHDEVDYY